MNTEKITVIAIVDAALSKVWDYYTNPVHIIHWNFADPSWHCPSAENDMRIGGTYKARMEAKDGSIGFYFEAVYTHLDMGHSFTYGFGDRSATVTFTPIESATEVVVTFDAETINPIAAQQAGWQAILNNFKAYTEEN